MTPGTEAIVIAAATTAAVGGLGSYAGWLLAKRSVPGAVIAAPLVVNLAVAAGILASARAMFISEHDLAMVLLVVGAATPVAVAFGLVLARRVHALEQQRALVLARERSERERDLQVESQRRELVAWASHDLRTPLAGVAALAEAIEDRIDGDPQEHARRIRHEVTRMTALVDDLLALSRITSGSWVPAPDVVSIADLLSDSVASLTPQARTRGVILRGGATGPVTALVDPREIGRVIDNLIGNAIHATPAGGTVDVQAAVVDQAAVISVADSCGGLSPDVQARMFEAWWRADAARSPRTGGSGLGLAVVYGIVVAHHGSVTVTSTERGCCVVVTMPMGQA